MGWFTDLKDGVGSVARDVGHVGAEVARGVGHAGAEVVRTHQDIAMRPLTTIAGLAGFGGQSFGSAFDGQAGATNPGQATDQINSTLDGVLQFIQKLIQLLGIGAAPQAQAQPQVQGSPCGGSGDVHVVVNR